MTTTPDTTRPSPAIARSLGLSVPRSVSVPHELVGFRLILDLRALRPDDGVLSAKENADA